MGKAVWGSIGIALCLLGLLMHDVVTRKHQAQTFAESCANKMAWFLNFVANTCASLHNHFWR